MELVKNYSKIFLLALIIRLILMPFLFHPDLKTQYYQVNFLSQGVFNIYDFLETNRHNLPYQDTFNYPPLIYYLLGSWNDLVKPILGKPYQNWLNDWGETAYTGSQIFRQLFVLKIPYLIFDFLVAGLLLKFVPIQKKKLVLILWLFNPVNLYIIYGLANFDIIPTFFSLLSLVFYKQKQYFLSGLGLSVGIAAKLFPVLYLPFFILPLLKNREFKKIASFLAGSLTIFLVSIILVWKDFLMISQSGLLTLSLNLRIGPLFGLYIPLFFFLYGAIVLISIFYKSTWQNLNLAILAVTFSVLGLIQFHPQWLLWSMPFLILAALDNLLLLWLVIPIIAGYVSLILTFNDRFLTLGIFSPLLPNIYDVASLEQTVFSHLSRNLLLLFSQLILGFSFLLVTFLKAKELWRTKNG